MQAKIMTLDETANGFLAWLNQKFNNTGPLPSIKVVCHPSEESWGNLEAVQKAMERLHEEHLTKLVTGYKNWAARRAPFWGFVRGFGFSHVR